MPCAKWNEIFTKEFLESEYVLKERTARDIAKQFKTDKTIVIYWIKKQGIAVKPNTRPVSDVLGQKFGDFEVIGKYGSDGSKFLWICKCKCGNLVKSSSSVLKNGKRKMCKTCHLIKVHKAASESNWKGCGDISNTKIRSIAYGAKSRGIKYEVTSEYLWGLFLKQDRKCSLTGVDLYFKSRGVNGKAGIASLDRIDSKKGYIEGNVQWVHKEVNLMKRSLSQETFIKICHMVSKRNKIEVT